MNCSYIRRAAREGRATAHLHGFCTLPCGGQEYCSDPKLIDGWAVYVRVATPQDPQPPFDLHEFAEHRTFDAAEKTVRSIARTPFGHSEAGGFELSEH